MRKNNFDRKGDDPKIEINKPSEQKDWKNPGFSLWLYIIFMMASLYLWQGFKHQQQKEIPYSEFLQKMQKGDIEEALVTDKSISGKFRQIDPDTQKPHYFVTVPLFNHELANELEKNGVKYTVRQGDHWLKTFFLNWILPIGLLFLIWNWMAKRMSGGAQSFLNIGGNRVRIHPEGDNKIAFKDVAGAEDAKQELSESIDFLKNPTLIQRLGGHMPKGILLVGPPGTGKTLLARAVAGEAEVPFFNISGSEFIEMFVGVGAARVRDMFDQARQKAPCIIFIDELDAIGAARGIRPIMGGHDEREQTLNQLLTEMDGFDPSSGVVVMAATNRPEVLDKALLRAGRFDRQIVIDKPSLEERIAILALHTKNMQIAQNVDLKVVAQRTPGFVGADLANIANEAAILAVRRHHEDITMLDFEAAIDRIIAGPEKKHRILGAAEKRRVAFHESGHTLVAESVPTGEPVHKVSIIPRGVAALGYTLQLPVQEKFLSTEKELKDQIAILLGGRVAEELVYDDISSGASNDLERSTEIAHEMVTRLGMSKKLGPLTYGKRQQLMYLGVQGTEEKNYSEETSRLIDSEVKILIEEGYQRATQILSEKRRVLDKLAALLEQKEVLNGEEIAAVIKENDLAKHV